MARRAPRRRVRGDRRARRPGRRERLGHPHRVGALLGARPLGRACRGPRSTAGATRRSPSRSSSTRSTRRPTRPPASASSARGSSRPTLIAYGTEEQKQRFLPKIQSVEELWCQGYSEPNAGSDLSNVHDARRPRRRPVGDQRPEGLDDARAPRAVVLRGRAHRTPTSPAHKGLSYLLVPMDQPGVEVRPLKQMTGYRRVQRGLLRRRAHRRGPRASARSTTAGRSRWRRSASSAAPRSCRSSSRSRRSSPS